MDERIPVLEWAVRTLLDERNRGTRLSNKEMALIRATLSPALSEPPQPAKGCACVGEHHDCQGTGEDH